MEIVNTAKQKDAVQPLQMVVYGEGGVGKTTFAASAPNVIIADCERGTKYLGRRGIDVDVVNIDSWPKFREFGSFVINKDTEHETVVIDPIGELMQLLQIDMRESGRSKLTQSDGSPTMAGWGWLKRELRDRLKKLRLSGKHVIIVAHIEEIEDENRLVKRPMLQTKLSEELINMVDIVAYMQVIEDPENPEDKKRVLRCEPDSDRYVAKDRTGKLGRFTKPDFNTIVETVYGETKVALGDENKSGNEEGEKEEEGAETANEEPKYGYGVQNKRLDTKRDIVENGKRPQMDTLAKHEGLDPSEYSRKDDLRGALRDALNNNEDSEKTETQDDKTVDNPFDQEVKDLQDQIKNKKNDREN